jgi:hypothetical protein
LGAGSVEQVPLYGQGPHTGYSEGSKASYPEDALTAPTVDTHSGDYVRIVASPPSKINMVPGNNGGQHNDRLPLASVDSQGFFKPGKEAIYSDKYLAGYEQIDLPEMYGGQFPGNINPDLIDPDDYHQDRPSFQSSDIQQSTHKEYYPLGKAPTPEQVNPDLLSSQGGHQQDPTNFSFQHKIDIRPAKKKHESKGSFFDFLIPSFVRSSNKADPEGPRQVKPRHKRPPPPPRGAPNMPHSLKAPNRPQGTFPHPLELGGKLNPILIRVPDQQAGSSFPGQHSFGQASSPPANAALKKKGLFKTEAEPENVIEDTAEVELVEYGPKVRPTGGPKTRPSMIMNLPPAPPLLRRPRPANTPLQMTSQPVIGLPRVPPGRKQVPFSPKKPPRPPVLLDLPGIPQPKHRHYHRPTTLPNNHVIKLKAEEYKQKLQDPDFHQVIPFSAKKNHC